MGDFRKCVMASQEYDSEIVRECLQAGRMAFLSDTLIVGHGLPNVPWSFLILVPEFCTSKRWHPQPLISHLFVSSVLTLR